MVTYFPYVNKLGYDKIIAIDDQPCPGNKYEFNIWDGLHGEFCGAGFMTKDQIAEFFKEYNIEDGYYLDS